MLSIGLTGGIGCGKSTVGRILESLGLARLDTDQISRDLVKKGTPGWSELVTAFGDVILTAEKEIDRKKLGEIVFRDGERRRELERILHPKIWKEVEVHLSRCRKSNRSNVVEVPLLFENDRQHAFDQVWVVACSTKEQVKRLSQRNGWSETETMARIASQMPLAEKIQRADCVIHNDADLASLRRSVEAQWSKTYNESENTAL